MGYSDKTDSNKTEKERTIEFLENRGFKLEQLDEGFEIRITHRSVGGGLNEIFVESDELEAVKNLGKPKILLLMYLLASGIITYAPEKGFNSELNSATGAEFWIPLKIMR